MVSNPADDEFDEKQEKLMLELVGKHVWKARREGAVVGALYSLLVVFLLWVALAELGPLTGVSAALYATCAVLVFDFWRRVFKKP